MTNFHSIRMDSTNIEKLVKNNDKNFAAENAKSTENELRTISQMKAKILRTLLLLPTKLHHKL